MRVRVRGERGAWKAKRRAVARKWPKSQFCRRICSGKKSRVPEGGSVSIARPTSTCSATVCPEVCFWPFAAPAAAWCAAFAAAFSAFFASFAAARFDRPSVLAPAASPAAAAPGAAGAAAFAATAFAAP